MLFSLFLSNFYTYMHSLSYITYQQIETYTSRAGAIKFHFKTSGSKIIHSNAYIYFKRSFEILIQIEI